MAEALFPLGDEKTILEEVTVLARENKNWLQKRYVEGVVDFNASVIAKLQSVGALKDSGGWAIFVTDGVGEASGSLSMVSEHKEVLVVAASNYDQTSQSLWPPSIRLLTNELVYAEGRYFLLSEDFTVDREYDSTYFIDALEIRDDEVDFTNSLARLFTIHNNGLAIYGRNNLGVNGAFTPSFAVKETVGVQERSVRPFGTYKCLEDRLYALDKAQGLMAEVMQLTPTVYLGQDI